MGQPVPKDLSPDVLEKVYALTPKGVSVIAKSKLFHEIVLRFFQGYHPDQISEWVSEHDESIPSRSIALYARAHFPKDLFEAAAAPYVDSVDAIAEMEALYKRQMARVRAIEEDLKTRGAKTSKWLADEIALARDILVKLQLMQMSLKAGSTEKPVPKQRVLDPEEAKALGQLIAEAYARGPMRRFQPKTIEDAVDA